MGEAAAIVLAAGKGTRMKSDKPKVLFEICGRPMVSYVCEAAWRANARRIVVVVGHGENLVRGALADSRGVEFVRQDPQLGTGHAAAAARKALKSFRGAALVLNGDAPLITPASLRKLLSKHRREKNDCTLLTSTVDTQGGKGRIVRNSRRAIVRIVEELDATPEERKIAETNVGFYCFQAPGLFNALKRIRPNNRKGEYYITDVVEVMLSGGKRVSSVRTNDPVETVAPNSQAQLATASQAMRMRILDRLMSAGVTIVDPESTFVESGAKIGGGTTLYPFSYISAGAGIGRGCRIGPFAHVPAGMRIADGGSVGGLPAPEDSDELNFSARR